ncbi:hypothetical protein LLEC1_06228 [Akanthomyces lecanii]|uniref:Peptidase M43 pregnancy-associated plasma-A domain-containing protein n=1 Tax=Cordyceps confragosa TaxID=2714763 RepID=A0A179IAJ0_CORDF|nr:hypothetical protein LLEC1_06228 [Akanthomyces lecanii]
MQLRHLFLSLVAAATCKAVAVDRPAMCGNPAPSKEYRQMLAEASAAEASASTHASVEARAPRTVNTWVHIIAADQTRSGGYISRDVVNAQMRVLNNNYASTGYQFSLQDVSYTVDYTWSDIRTDWDLTRLKAYLRKGTYADLNLYYFRSITDYNTGSGLTGYCNYPANGNDYGVYNNDGCNLHVETMPGGTFSPWNQGKITSHEVGHWFGLIHPWGDYNTGGCSGAGDQVSDTPAQYSPDYGCRVGYDSCPYSPGTDPVRNIMGYSDNSCVNEFTAGQITRMNTMYGQYRG